MTTGRTGAVHLSFPKDVLDDVTAWPPTAGGPGGAAVYADPACAAYPAYRTRPDGTQVERAAELLGAAERPVMVCGGGVHLSHAYAEVENLAELLSMPVATSINGKGSISEDHPLALGVIGANGGRAFAHEVVRESDLILFVGSRVNYVTTNDWSAPPKDFSGKIIQIDVDGGEIGNNLRVEVGLAGDAKLALADLATAVRARKPRSRDTAGMIQPRLRSWWDAQQPKMFSAERPMRPQRIIHELGDCLPEDAVIVADPGTATPFVAAHYPLPRAGRFTVIPRAHGGLGYAVPAVVGACFARPHATIVCLTGDGSFGFSVGELETIARLHLKVVVIQFNNGTFGWIKELQHLHHGDRYFGVDFTAQDCAAIARSFGWLGIRVEDPDEFKAALQEALDAGAPAFIDVVSADQVLETPPVAAWQEAEQRLAH